MPRLRRCVASCVVWTLSLDCGRSQDMAHLEQGSQRDVRMSPFSRSVTVKTTKLRLFVSSLAARSTAPSYLSTPFFCHLMPKTAYLTNTLDVHLKRAGVFLLYPILHIPGSDDPSQAHRSA